MKRRKTRIGKGRGKARQPLIRLIAVDAAIATASLAGPAAMAAPGELDPSFGDAGRQTMDAAFWTDYQSVDVADDDSLLYGAGGLYCSYYYSCYEGSFFGELQPDGSADPGYVPGVPASVVVHDTLRQPDGKLIGFGRTRTPDGGQAVQVFRLLPNGALDTGFGIGGFTTVSNNGFPTALAVTGLLDPDGRIVVTGFRYPEFFIARFLANGTLDPSFGTAGVQALAPAAGGYLGSPVRMVRPSTGGYRLILHEGGGGNGVNGCSVRAITAAGAFDTSFGQSGVVPVAAPSGVTGPVVCESLALQTDGKLVLAGSVGNTGAFIGRLQPSGTPDSGFDATAAAARLSQAKVAAVAADGKILVAGSSSLGSVGSLVTRLRSDGAIDATYGRNGTTQIDLKAERTALARIGDLAVLPDGRAVVVGTAFVDSSARLFAARLLGAEGAGAGVLGIKEAFTLRREQDGTVALKVMRTGGRSGATSVTYTARALPGTDFASAGADFTAVSGRLTWADGDDGEREIVVPLLADGVDEPPEQFEVVLSNPEGGAGLGAVGGTVEIGDLGYPAGALSVSSPQSVVAEGGYASLMVQRNHYAQGPISVTVRVKAGGTATSGADFANRQADQNWRDVVVSWGAGDQTAKGVLVYMKTDLEDEPNESVTFELVSPTGGAVIGTQSTTTVTIQNTAASGGGGGGGGNGGGGDGGGGAWGGLGALLLGLGGLARRWRPRLR